MRTGALFLCTGNSCRGQMAEGWARHLSGDRVDAYSAGIEAHGMNPNAVRVMQEAGVAISGRSSKRGQHAGRHSAGSGRHDVRSCGRELPGVSGPGAPGACRVDDPPKLARSAAIEEEALSHYRRVRDEIRDFVKTGLMELIGGDRRTPFLVAVGVSRMRAKGNRPCRK